MLEPEYRLSTRNMNIEVEDNKGNVETFSSVEDVADALKCSRTYVYRALRTGVKIVGCKVRMVER